MEVERLELLEASESLGESFEYVVSAVELSEVDESVDRVGKEFEPIAVELETRQAHELPHRLGRDRGKLGEGEVEDGQAVRGNFESGEGDLGDKVVAEVELLDLCAKKGRLDGDDVVCLRLEVLEPRQSVRQREVRQPIPTAVKLPQVLEPRKLGREGVDRVADDGETLEVDELADLGRKMRDGVEREIEVDEGLDLADDGGEGVERVVGDVEVFERSELGEVGGEDGESIVLDLERHQPGNAVESSRVEVADSIARDVEPGERGAQSDRGGNLLEEHVRHSELSKRRAVDDEVGRQLLEGVLGEVEVDDGVGVSVEEDGEDLKVFARKIDVFERVKGIFFALQDQKRRPKKSDSCIGDGKGK
jgi:hypothetical protein